jgi:GNAT superfamily N-acetyltransferase
VPVPAPVDAFWASRLGCLPADLCRPGTTVTTLTEEDPDSDAPFAFAWWREPALVVAVPAGWRAAAERLAAADPAETFQAERLRAAFGDAAGEVVGPAYQGWVDAAGFRPAPAGGVRPLGSGDRAALDELRRAAGESAWEHSAIDPDRPPLLGRFDGDRLVAAGTLAGWGEPVVHVGVLTHPAARRLGHGRAVVTSLTRAALDVGSVIHYQTLDGNAGSLAVARALGYRRHATTLAVRLQPGSRP